MIIDDFSIETHVVIGIFFFFCIACVLADFKTKKKIVADLLLIHLCFCEGLGALWGIVDATLIFRLKNCTEL